MVINLYGVLDLARGNVVRACLLLFYPPDLMWIILSFPIAFYPLIFTFNYKQ